MDDRKLVDLAARRQEKARERRKAALAQRKPSVTTIAWAAFLTAAVVGYVVFRPDAGFNRGATSPSGAPTTDADAKPAL